LWGVRGLFTKGVGGCGGRGVVVVMIA
jgi:hypothetical protein